MPFSVTAFSTLVLLVSARDVVFPPVLPVQGAASAQGLWGMGGGPDTDFSGSRFHGLTTFANLPYEPCFEEDPWAAGKYDIAILGAQFDTVS